ncbi:CDGSH iron-sulfur domain-containing protein [Ruminococcaceae bacterium OttesenSCG-928-A16]|nr:CDGSH iron-sulfur domain-containing protein [Ruminococcaceae bacterium OttesenSCG-928-A16]
MEEDKKIKILPNGPYEVTETVPLKIAEIVIDAEGTSETWKTGKEYDAQPEPYHLCRCGHSKTKPYCDGSHKEVGFEGEETTRRSGYVENAVRYEGEAFDLLDDESLCASMRFCDRGLGAWDAAIESGNAENKQMAIEECAACAAGRLTLVAKDGTVLEPSLPQEINLVQDTAAQMRGPLWVKGGIQLEGADGQPYEVRNRMTLCRCGESSNLPFCDTSHLHCPHMNGHDE